ncbi:MAG: threonylcarbamoyl-AMP synthase [Gammaproteobacteria bacterium]|nr:threonylcarbamoyl-AMP synthase [Gammaproteobacteria bacterium]
MLEDTLQPAIEVLRDGGIIAYPTEAVYGLGCDPRNEAAVRRLVVLKQRPLHKGLILIAATLEQLRPYTAAVTDAQWQRVLPTWPGPVTWVFPAKPTVSTALRGDHSTIAVRVTAHPVARALCDGFAAAIVSSSANIAAQPPARTVDEVRAQFPSGIDWIVSGDVDRNARPSEIRDVLTNSVLRCG